MRLQTREAVDVSKAIATGTSSCVWEGLNIVGNGTVHPLTEKDLKSDHGKEQQRQQCEEEHYEDLQIICM